MISLLEDLKFSLRLLKKTPVFSFTCLGVITLGLAVAISNFSLTHEFRKPPPFIDGDRFVGLRVNNEITGESYNWDYFNAYAFNAIREQQRSFEFIDGVQFYFVSVFDDGLASRHYLADVTPNLLANTKVQPLLGRIYSENDATTSQDSVILIAYNVWQNTFLADPNIIGRSVDIEGRFHTIIGVMPEGFNYPLSQDIWLLNPINQPAPLDGTERTAIVAKRLPGESNEAATAEINRIINQ